MINVSLFFDKRKAKDDGTFPVKILILFPQPILRSIGRISLTEDEWEKLNNSKLRDKNLIEIKEKLNQEVQRAEGIINDLGTHLTRDKFLKLFDIYKKQKTNTIEETPKSSKKNRKKDIYKLFEEVIQSYDEVDSGTGENYGKALKSFRDFKPNVKYSDLIPQFFQDYETHMLNIGNSLTTTGIYCRAFRKVINIAMKAGYIKLNDYPFGKRTEGKYPIPQGERKDRRALDGEALKDFISYESDIEEENYAHSLTLFCFYCNGMNIRDVFHLRPDNITDEFIYFVRGKTRRMTSKTIKIKVPLTSKVRYILEQWGTINPRKDEYIFPLLNTLLTEDFGTNDLKQKSILFKKAAYRLIKNEIRKLNRILLKIEKKINAPIHLSTEIGRYSWANFLDRSGAPLKFIQAGLGHTRPETTLHYLENMREQDEKQFVDALEAI